MSIIVTQLGARMHYAVPRILQRAGLLERFYTDICALKGWPRLLRFVPMDWWPPGIRRLLMRVPSGIPPERITAFTSFGWQYALRLRRAHSVAERDSIYLWGGPEFCRRVIGCGFNGARAVYTFNSAGLELLQAAHRQGVKGVVEQTITPRAVECQLLAEELSNFPAWEPRADEGMMAEYIARERAEWNEADLVVCASEYVREGIIACGGAPEKCVVVPYGLEPRTFGSKKPHERHGGPLRVLTVGSVCLRKGAPYVLAAARRMGGAATFRMVGDIQVLPEAEHELRAHVELIGAIPRAEVLSHYAWADVFLLPSLCEGSATVTYEALFNGLPVICTPNTGAVIRDGVDGYLVPVRDVDAIVAVLGKLAVAPDRVAAMSDSARVRSQDYTLEKYGERLVRVLQERFLL